MKHLCPVPVRREKAVVEILKFLGFSAELPVVRSARSRLTAARRRKTSKTPETLVPLMNGYVLVSFEGGKPLLWHRLVDIGLIRRGRSLAVTEADIQRMIATHDQLTAALAPRAPRQWRPGDLGKIKDGPFNGRSAIIRHVRGPTAETICEGRKVVVQTSQLEAA